MFGLIVTLRLCYGLIEIAETMKIGKLYDGMLIMASLVGITLLGSCDKGISEDERENQEPGVYDLTISDVGMFGAKLNAKVTMPEQVGKDFELGFEVSESSTFPTELTKKYMVEHYNPDKTFSYELSDLKLDVTYYVRAYMISQMCFYTTQVKTFMTTAVKVITGDIDLKTYSVRSQTNVERNASKEVVYGVRCGVDEEFSSALYYGGGVSETVDEDNSYEASLDLTSIPYGTVYYQSFVTIGEATFYGDVKSFEYVYECPVPEKVNYVDLGLSVKWADCNVGALVPEDYGYHFAWGETVTKPYYSVSTYKFWDGNLGVARYTKYCTNSEYGEVDGKTTLEECDDAAFASWGEGCRMPTEEEFQELVDSCIWNWTTVNGVSGYEVKSGVNGNSIFLPAAGSKHYRNTIYVGEMGAYWSISLLDELSQCANSLYFNSSRFEVISDSRNDGLSVRAVSPVSISWLRIDKGAIELNLGGSVPLVLFAKFENGAEKRMKGTWASSNVRVAEVNQEGEVRAVSAGMCTISASIGDYLAVCTVTVNEHEVIDLGLSVKWAACNIGATTPEEYGGYFAWGETEPKSAYSWDNYKHSHLRNYSLTKYCSNSFYGCNGYIDDKTILDFEDDAAHVNWGGSWRMPTGEEFDELCNSENCTWIWTRMNGVNGYRIVSKRAGYEGNYIFLPGGGYRSSGSHLVNFGDCNYWSSSLATSSPDCAHFLQSGIGSGDYSTYIHSRDAGLSVRPVRPKD